LVHTRGHAQEALVQKKNTSEVLQDKEEARGMMDDSGALLVPTAAGTG
jgi:hypothetical protein